MPRPGETLFSDAELDAVMGRGLTVAAAAVELGCSRHLVSTRWRRLRKSRGQAVQASWSYGWEEKLRFVPKRAAVEKLLATEREEAVRERWGRCASDLMGRAGA